MGQPIGNLPVMRDATLEMAIRNATRLMQAGAQVPEHIRLNLNFLFQSALAPE